MYYLKPNVKSEPLFCGWYLWTHLVSPLTAGCNLLNRYIPIMESFISAPNLHEEALKMPEMIGSPFIDLPKEESSSVKRLLENTKNNALKLLTLASEYKNFDALLSEERNGESLEDMYDKIPICLKGMLELVYSGNNVPNIRLIEKFLYSRYYDKSLYKMHLSFINNDKRPFLLTTPRILSSDDVVLRNDFADTKYDTLYASRYAPINLITLMEQFEIHNDIREDFRNLFTEVPPQLPENRDFNGLGVRIRYFGHACMLIQTKHTSILIDPIISYHYPNDLARYTYYDLPDSIDYVLVTHNHQDHIQFETLFQIRHKIKNIIVPQNNTGSILDPSLKIMLNYLGFNNVRTLGEFEAVDLIDGTIIGLPFLGEHGDLDIFSKLAYSIKLGKKSFMFVADSNNLDEELYHNIRHEIGSVDTSFVGMECEGAPLSWVYAPLLTKPLARKFDQQRRLSGSNCKKIINLIETMQCKESYVYAMGQEPWLGYIMGLNYKEDSPQIVQSNQFLTHCLSNNIISRRLYGKHEIIYE